MQRFSVDAVIGYGWWQEREGINAAHLPATRAGCLLVEPGVGGLIQPRRQQPAAAKRGLVGFYLHECAGVAGTCPPSQYQHWDGAGSPQGA